MDFGIMPVKANRMSDKEFASLMRSFEALLLAMRKTERTLNDQDEAKTQMSASIKTLDSLKEAVSSAYEASVKLVSKV